ncbi:MULTISPECIES: aminotransferase class I/II-fold pyridoxal phosphate-dependent enzyme [unclassified Isoptericola]|uniref:aminotransferase class I/II-fold pyridoxal phosphate-dependent enzyme n=1 Tax=unclassified Isoptericola TaxID=2623355 RepID=UPI0037904493|nr:aminotransferase class I/II-fold pyridoxal phosphate-dependent enzyme [Isoptericola sp. QY 916]
MKVSRRSHVPPFAVMQVLATANERRAAGHDVLNLCAGEPSTGASDVVREKAAELLRTADLGYTESMGVPALRREIAGHYRRWYDVDVDPARIAVTTGSSGGFLLAFLAAFDVGDRVALARPGYPAYKNILAALGCEVVELDCGPDTRYQPTVSQLMEAYYEGGLDGLVVASPANPTGTMLPPAELAALARWCEEHDVRLISDEIYHGIAYSTDVQQATAAMYTDAGAVVVNSFSKYWAMTGWRLGWLVLPDELVGPVDALAGNVALSPPALAQHAGVAAFSPAGYAAAAENVARYAASRAALLDRVDELGWRPVAPADGAFYLYGNVAGFRDAVGGDSVTYCRRLLAEADVAITPGADFDVVGGGDWVRLSFAAAPDVVSRAVDRIVAWHRTL